VRTPLPSILLAGLLAACSSPTNRTGEALRATGKLVALSGGEGGAQNACFRCHGLDGRGDGVSAPRLAGLDAGYLHKQMRDYAAGLRRDETMMSIAKWLTDEDQQAVAEYYAAMTPAAKAPLGAHPPPAAYFRDDPSRGLMACAACHGAKGQGVGAANPALAGQPAAYTLQQLRRWKRAERRNDPRGVMKAAVEGLTEAEMATIAAWLERQPASPRRDSAAATAFAAAAVAEGPAASRAARRPDR
jgi:cytochrome c553